jgi:hypothetical protein
MRHFLQYWKHHNQGDYLNCSASKQFSKRHLTIGDSLWLVTLSEGKLILLGNLVIHKLLSPTQARRKFRSNLYPSDKYAVPASAPMDPIAPVDISEIAHDLRFDAESDRLAAFGNKPINGRQLQSLRLLTEESAQLLATFAEASQDPESTPIANDLPENLPVGELKPGRTLTSTYRILRDTELCRRLKKLHKDRCQICGLTIALSNGETYSEAHHIKPLGKPYNGSDVAGNILIVCPNHHAMLDFGAIELSMSALATHLLHRISSASIHHHNSFCRKQRRRISHIPK